MPKDVDNALVEAGRVLRDAGIPHPSDADVVSYIAAAKAMMDAVHRIPKSISLFVEPANYFRVTLLSVDAN